MSRTALAHSHSIIIKTLVILALTIAFATSIVLAQENPSDATLDETMRFVQEMVLQGDGRNWLLPIQSFEADGCTVTISAHGRTETFVTIFNLARLTDVKIQNTPASPYGYVGFTGAIKLAVHDSDWDGDGTEFYENQNFVSLRFDDGYRAERVANALTHAWKLCRGD
jgi:hypothetical protein